MCERQKREAIATEAMPSEPLPEGFGRVLVDAVKIIPPQHEAVVAVRLEAAPLRRGEQYLFEPLPHLQLQRPWRAARCLQQTPLIAGPLLVRVMNPTTYENVTLYPGVRLGTWEQLSAQQIGGITLYLSLIHI